MDTTVFPIISADASKLIIGLPNVVLVDARGGPDAAERGVLGRMVAERETNCHCCASLTQQQV